MTYSVLTKVTNSMYNGQKFFMYKSVGDNLTILTSEEANKLKDILDSYPNVFSETEVLPKSKSEIRLLDPSRREEGRELSFSFQNVEDDCPDIFDHLQEAFDNEISGIDRDETKRQIFENE